MVNFKALGKALLPKKGDFVILLAVIALSVVVLGIGAVLFAGIFGIFYMLSLFLSKETVTTISWIATVGFWFWLLFYDTIKDRYDRYCREGNDNVS